MSNKNKDKVLSSVSAFLDIQNEIVKKESELVELRERLVGLSEELSGVFPVGDSGNSSKAPKKFSAGGKKRGRPRRNTEGTIKDAVLAYAQAHKKFSIKDLKESLPDRNPASVDQTVMVLAKDGQLKKIDRGVYAKG